MTTTANLYTPCDGCGEHLQTVVIDNLNLCTYCYANYIYEDDIPQAFKIEREDEFGQRI